MTFKSKPYFYNNQHLRFISMTLSSFREYHNLSDRKLDFIAEKSYGCYVGILSSIIPFFGNNKTKPLKFSDISLITHLNIKLTKKTKFEQS